MAGIQVSLSSSAETPQKKIPDTKEALDGALKGFVSSTYTIAYFLSSDERYTLFKGIYDKV